MKYNEYFENKEGIFRVLYNDDRFGTLILEPKDIASLRNNERP